jgi:hypothetical protein
LIGYSKVFFDFVDDCCFGFSSKDFKSTPGNNYDLRVSYHLLNHVRNTFEKQIPSAWLHFLSYIILSRNKYFQTLANPSAEP